MSEPDDPSSEYRKPRAEFNPVVFFGSGALILLFVLFSALLPDTAGTLFSATQAWIVDTFGWFYLLAVAVFLLFSAALAISSYGAIRLGPDHSRPDYSNISWFSMLFSAGMGIGLLFFGVGEPIMHYVSPPQGDGATIPAAREAMSLTFFHWGLHAWSIYAVIGMSLAYFSFRHQLPLTIRSALYPLIGERIYGPIGHIVDIFAVLGTMFGIATSLGLGVMQINAGLGYLFDIPVSLGVQITLIAAITLMATASVVAGLDSGIKRLSELNLLLAVILMLFMLSFGPTQHLLEALVQNVGNYLSEVVGKTFNLYAYEPNEWLGSWTLFYWGWWMAWSPFVGMFIARVSRGRTIREFVCGVLFVPVGFTFMWMTFFGNTAIYLELNEAAGGISAAVSDNLPVALFQTLEYLPLSELSSGVATLLVITFFVTSSDSGSLVIDVITSGGKTDPPLWQRIFWAITEGVVAAVLLLAGGLGALQTASIAGALPFAVIMLLICYGLWRGLRLEHLRTISHGMLPSPVLGGERVPWQKRLRSLVSHPERNKVYRYLMTTGWEALRDVAEELRRHDMDARLDRGDDRITLTVFYNGVPDFTYALEMREYTAPTFAFPESEHPDKQPHYYRAEVHLAEGGQGYDVMDYTKDQLIGDILSHYEKHRHFLHVSAN
jgi:choline/glycine/proline betaine transport protein